MKRLYAAIAALNLLLPCTPTVANTVDDDHLSPSVSWEVIYKASLLSGKVKGEPRLNGAHGNLDLKVSVDGAQAWGIPGSELFIYLLNTHGNRLNEQLGTAQGVDNIEAHVNTLVYQFWIQQSLLDDQLSLRAGLYDLNSEFYVTDASALFLMPPFGIGTELAQTGKHGPSIFPVTSLSARIKFQPTPEWYWQTAILDGVPGDPDHPKGTRIRIGHNDGQLQISEIAYLPNANDDEAPTSKLALGVWRYTQRFDDLIDTDTNGNPVQRRERGVYVLGETTLYRDPVNPNRGLDGFLRYGIASPDINQFERAINAGLVYTGLFNGREQDQLGLGVAAARTSPKFRDVALQSGEPVLNSEISYELSYRARINDAFSIQPVFQYIRNLGDPAIKNVRVAGVRLEFNFGSD